MKKQYNEEAVEKVVESIWEELEPKIAKELCKRLKIEHKNQIRTIDDVQKAFGFYLGFCHAVWNTQKMVLKRDYNIDWKTPAELNPDVIYD